VSGRIVIISASIGAGHDGIANELAARLSGRGFEVVVADFLDLLPGGTALRRIYAWQLSRAPMTWDLLYTALERHRVLARVSARLAQLARSRTARLIIDRTVAVVSTYPLASQVLGRMRRSGRLAVPVATFLCDMSVHPLWVAAGIDAHLAMHKVPADEARSLGAAGVTLTAPVVAAGFRVADSPQEVARARARFGLPPDRPLALVLAGSWGVGEVVQTSIDVASCGIAEPVVVCGHNTDLRRRLCETGIGVALGWVDDMPTLLHAVDVVIHNAGGLSCMEALAAGLPVLTYRPLSGHGRTNVAALAQAGLVTHADSAARLHMLLKETLAEEVRGVTAGPADNLWTNPDPATVIAAMATSGRSNPDCPQSSSPDEPQSA
jgi:UDP-N-acetylglucosamine:LPS N-acetylglucosamine transferase